MGIVEFLTARLDDREQWARAAGHHVGTKYDPITLSACETVSVPLMELYRDARPARVLVEVAAKRTLLAQATEMRELAADTEAWFLDDLADRIERNLAMPYADHHDYDPAWRVQ